MDEQRRRAEADKLAAITELEHRSQEFMREKSAKMALEEKIAALQGQLLIGGNAAQVTPAIRCALPRRGMRSCAQSRCIECTQATCGKSVVSREALLLRCLAQTAATQWHSGYRNMLEEEQSKVRSEYESRFRDLERERVAIQDDKAKVRLVREPHVFRGRVAAPSAGSRSALTTAGYHTARLRREQVMKDAESPMRACMCVATIRASHF